MIPVAALIWGTALAACIALNFTALPDWLGTHLAAPDADEHPQKIRSAPALEGQTRCENQNQHPMEETSSCPQV